MIEQRGQMPVLLFKVVDALTRANDGKLDEYYQGRQLQRATEYFEELVNWLKLEGKNARQAEPWDRAFDDAEEPQ